MDLQEREIVRKSFQKVQLSILIYLVRLMRMMLYLKMEAAIRSSHTRLVTTMIEYIKFIDLLYQAGTEVLLKSVKSFLLAPH